MNTTTHHHETRDARRLAETVRSDAAETRRASSHHAYTTATAATAAETVTYGCGCTFVVVLPAAPLRRLAARHGLVCPRHHVGMAR